MLHPNVPRLALAAAMVVVGLAGAGGAALAQEASPLAGTPVSAGQGVDATLRDAEGNDVGYAALTEVAGGEVQINVYVEPGTLEPGEHGIHLHETGVCDAEGDEPFTSAGGHYNPTGASHGGPDDEEAHAGDLGNIATGEDGDASAVITSDRFSLAELNDADGSALVIHAERDDLETDPGGDSGRRVVCGVVFAPHGAGTPVAATPAP